MKKIYLAVFLACTVGGAAHAQISEGGIPWSMNLQNEVIANQNVARVELPAPDYESYLKQDEQDALAGTPKPYRVSAMVTTDIDMNKSGSWAYFEDGRKIWRLYITIPGAQALDFFYNKFALPEGVKYYLTNANGKQLLGAYTHANQNEFHSFTNTEVQGNTAILEMDIPADIDIQTVGFHIHKIGAAYRGYENLNKLFGSSSNVLLKPTDGSSPCHINANCPDGDGAAWAKAKSATVRINIDGAGWCTGTLINNTGNAADGTCKPYMLTASHCDEDNSRDDEHFANWKFDFNYQTIECDGAALETVRTRTGAYFRSRSNLPSFPTPDHSYVADFLFLELRESPQPVANAYLAGWNRSVSFTDETIDYKFIGFHHPAGDLKKLCRSNYVDPSGRFNQTSVPGTHWETSFTVGGMEPGSSGSGFFDKDGLLIGDLSGGAPGTGTCAPMGINALYCKLSYAWNNEFDQTAFPEHAGAASRLKDWLDPANLGTTTLSPTKSDCSDFTDIKDVEKELQSNVLVYPSPTTNGLITLKTNFTEPTDLSIVIYDIMGAKKLSFDTKNVSSKEIALDLSSLANGTYIVMLGSKNATASHKIVIAQ